MRSRRLGVTAAVGAVVMVVVAGVTLAVRHGAGAVATIASADIVALSAMPYPEGTIPPAVGRGAPGARAIYGLLPQRIARPVAQRQGCEPDVFVYVTLRDGESLSYGPCGVPKELAHIGSLVFEPPRTPVVAFHVRTSGGRSILDRDSGMPGFDKLVAHLPWPLPWVSEQGTCPPGVIVELDTADGGRVTYGPCNIPVPINALVPLIPPD